MSDDHRDTKTTKGTFQLTALHESTHGSNNYQFGNNNKYWTDGQSNTNILVYLHCIIMGYFRKKKTPTAGTSLVCRCL